MTPQQVDFHTLPFECTAREDGRPLEAQLGHGCRRVEANEEADSLANWDVSGFNPDLEIHFDPRTIHWDIFPKALEIGRKAETETQTLSDRTRPQKRRKPEHKLRVADPWWHHRWVFVGSTPLAHPVIASRHRVIVTADALDFPVGSFSQ